MKKKALFVGMALLWFSAPLCHAAEVDPDGAGWRLIHEEPPGELLSVAPATMERTAEGFIRIWMKFETRAENSPSPMLFLNELDCAGGLIKRIEAKLYRPTCSGSNEPMQSLSFDGKWDRPSAGIEEYLREAVCNEDGAKVSL